MIKPTPSTYVQARLILDAVGPQGHVTFMSDGDEASRKCCDGLVKDGTWEPGALRQLASRVYVRVIELADGMQPDKLDEDTIRALVGERERRST